MDFSHSPRTLDLMARLNAFMDEHVYPAEERYDQEVATGERWKALEVIEELKVKARAAGLWNLFLPESELGAGLTNVEYAPLAEIMGRVLWCSEVFNCSAPDTGNMEVLVRYGSEAQKARWLQPLLDGQIRSAFAMTEPAEASSDATNIAARIERDGDHYVINARKWWTSGAADPRTAVFIFMGKTDPDNPDRHRQQSMILVPRDTPGIRIVRHLTVFGYDDAPHGHAEIDFENVRVPVENLILGEGRGFEIAQGRLGPGRIHHCMRVIGAAERALERMCRQTLRRSTFGKPISDRTVTRERIANARIQIDQARLLVLKAAWLMDTVGNKVARKEIAMMKVAAANMACQVIDWAIQAHGGGGVDHHTGLTHPYTYARALRIADGPDEVHRNQVAKIELSQYRRARWKNEMQQFKGRTAVITGAASGFGLALAHHLAGLGMRLVMADAQAERLRAAADEVVAQVAAQGAGQGTASGATAGAQVLALTVDVSSAAAMEALRDRTLERFGVPHLVFNNAGVTCGGFIWEHTLAQWEWLLGVNLMGVVHGVRLFTPLMLDAAARDPSYEGHIVNSASMAGLLSLPNVGAYTVSKHAVVALSETLFQDLALVTDRVHASVLCPYSVPTGIAQSQKVWAASGGGALAAATPSQQVAQALTEQSVSKGRVTAEDIAQAVVEAVRARRFYVFSHPKALGTVRTRMEDIVEGRNPSDPFAERPDLRAQLMAALRAGQAAGPTS